MTTAIAGPTPTETALGSTQVPVKYLSGQEEQITIRQLPMRKVADFARAIDDPAQVICLCTGKKVEWTDALTPDTFELLAHECDRLNRDFFLRWTALQRERLAVLGPPPAATS